MRPQLLHLSGADRGRTATYPERNLTFGSAADCTVPLHGAAVAEHHARLDWVEDQCAFLLRALGGQVFVNGDEIEEVVLQDEDRIEFGVDGPVLRFHVYVPQGSVCKPVRRMLADARAVARVSGGAAATRSLTRDLFTQATMQLKVGFPVGVVLAALLAGWLGGWLGTRAGRAPAPRTVDTVSRAELEELRAQQQRQREDLLRLAKSNAVVRAVQQEWSRGVCLLHGAFRLRQPDGTWFAADSEPYEVEYTGTGFLATGQGHVITNRHVVSPWENQAEAVMLTKVGMKPEFVHFTATFPGRAPVDVPIDAILRRQDDLDVAVLALPEAAVAGLPVLPLQREPRENDGQRAVVVGYPTGLALLLARADEQLVDTLRRSQANMTQAIASLAGAGQITPLITQGIVSNVDEHKIVYDAPTTHGGSGGPVFDGNGEVIAVNYAIMPDYVGANFGVPIRFARELLPQ
jgi:S1-C subfamily serine protease